MISLTPREGFSPKFEVVSCYLEYQGKFLLLQRQTHKPQPGTFGIPAGKVDSGESLESALMREIREETGIVLKSPVYAASTYVQHGDYEFIYHMYSSPYDTTQSITINPEEHAQYLRKTPQEALDMDLIPDEDFCIKLFYQLP